MKTSKLKDGSIISISGIDYTLHYIKDLKDESGERELWGHFKILTREILLDNSLTPSNLYNTLVHEMIHAILEHAGLASIEENEQLCNAIAYGLESIRINNQRWIE